MIRRNCILPLNSRRIMCAEMSRREAAFPSAGMAGPMDNFNFTDPQPVPP